MNIFKKAGKITNNFFGLGKKNLKTSVNEVLDEHSGNTDKISAEIEIFENLIEFRDLKAYEVMIPRTEMICAEINTPKDEIVKLYINSGHTRIPIYRQNLDDIIGFLHVKDLIRYLDNSDNQPQQFSIKKELREVIFTPRSTKIMELLHRMKEKVIHMAIVLDEYGGTDGIITMSDIIAQIVGDIKDEHDLEIANSIIQKGDRIIVDARVEIEDLEAKIGLSLSDEEGEYETVGGFVLSCFGKIPHAGEILIHSSGVEFEILEAEKTRISKISVKPPLSRKK